MHFVYIALYWILLIQHANCYWVDPFDMLGYNHATKSRDQGANENTEVPEIPETHSCNSIEERYFIKRFINLILENSGITKENLKSGHTLSLLEVKIDLDKLKYLQNLLKKQNFSLQELDQTISSVIFPYKLQESFDYSTLLSWPSTEIWHKIFITLTAILPCVAFFTSTGMKKSIGYTLLILFAASYFIRYHKLLQEAEIHQHIAMSKNIPDNCIGGDQTSWWNYFMNLLSTDDSCTKYLQTVKIEAKYRVTPTRVFGEVFFEPFLYLMENFGLHFSNFSNNIFSGVPWFYVPIVYICSCFLILLSSFGIIAMLCGQNIKLFGLQIFQGNQNISRNEVILQRPMIEDLSTVPSCEENDLTIEQHSNGEISDKINNSEQYKCDKCQKAVDDLNVQVLNSNKQQPFPINHEHIDSLDETETENSFR